MKFCCCEATVVVGRVVFCCRAETGMETKLAFRGEPGYRVRIATDASRLLESSEVRFLTSLVFRIARLLL